MKVNIETLEDLCLTKLIRSGLPQSAARIVFNHLLDEELLGKRSHGFIRMPAILDAISGFDGESETVIETVSPYAKRLIVKNTLGLVAASQVVDCTIETAKRNGIAMVSGVGYAGTTGALGYYGRMLAEEGLIGIITCSSEYAVAPWGGKDAILGTNPIAIAFPNGDSPVISDFATAAMTYGDLMLAVKESRTVPYGIVLDTDGKPSHDPNDANNGAQLPMAQHKGYALSLAVEIIAGLFIGAKAGKNAVLGSDGIIMFAVKPNLFVPEREYYSHISALIKEIKSSSPAQDSTGIHIPGEGSIKRIKDGYDANLCEISDAVYDDLLKL